jgi:hypothetical protein
MAEETPKTPAEYADMMKKATTINAADFVEAFERVGSVAREVNNTFGQSRERINEVKVALTDALPNVVRLGGDLGAVGETIGQIAEASRRNVVANTEDVQKLYASTKVIGGSVKEIADGFLNVGVGIEQVGKQLEDSVNYVRSIGGNTKQVMADVRSNMEQMNRYQFEGGVQGLTKMAAQASMLRFDMGETFRLADKVLNPEGAIEVAAAFQRLGVSAGALADPFQLMNQSINDPSGLQNSLADVAKQFTYFDEKTKTFKINPQGVLTLREMEQQTGVSAKEMSKMGLAAAELDQRLSSINAAGLKLGSEEDKQYLANIAKMGEGGQYEVKLTNEKGELETRKLSELTQDEFDKLIKEQKEGPKTMEEIAKSQMTISADIAGNVSAIKSAVLGGAVTQKDVLTGSEAIRKLSSSLTGALSKNFSSPQKVRDTLTDSFDDVKSLFKDIANKDVSTTDALSNYLTKAGVQLQDLSKDAQANIIKTLQETRSQLGDKNAIDRNARSFIDQMLGETKTQTTRNTGDGNKPISSLIEGTNATSKVKDVVSSNGGPFGGGNKSQVDFGGGIKIDVNFNGGAENLTSAQKEEITKMLIEKMNSTDMKQYMIEVNTPNNPTKAPTGKTVTR